MWLVFCLATIVIMVSCVTKEKIPAPNNNISPSVPNEGEDVEEQIAFLFMYMTKDPVNGEKTITLNDKTITPGSMRNDNSPAVKWNHYLTIKVYESGKLRETFYLEHPLFRRVEYVDSNSQLVTKTIEHSESDFFIRLQIKKRNTSIDISETLGETPEKELASLEIF